MSNTVLSRAGHLRYFWIFFNNKNDLFAFFIKFITSISAPVLFKGPLSVTLIKNAKNNFLLLKKLKNTESAQLWFCHFKKSL